MTDSLRAAAQKVVDETDRIHDSEPWPVKYRAPYGAITELRAVLKALPIEPNIDAAAEVISDGTGLPLVDCRYLAKLALEAAHRVSS